MDRDADRRSAPAGSKERVTQQLATLEAERRERLKEKPAPVVVGLKTLSLKARRL